jgi:hypothetical protein
MVYLQTITNTVNDPISTAISAYTLKNLIVGVPTATAVLTGGTSAPVTPSDIRLKRDITKLVKLDNGLSLYRFRYIWSDTYYVGVMAQEVERVVPEAVIRGADGYLRVNYARLGLRFVTWNEWVADQRIAPVPVNWSVVEPALSRR